MTRRTTSPKTHKAKSANQLTVRAPKLGPTVLLDSSFILAVLDPRDPNHKASRSIFGFLDPYNCRFHIPLYVFAEVISKLIHMKGKVSDALKTLDEFFERLHGVRFSGTNPTADEIVNRYKVLAKNQIRFLQSNDFFIATEGILSKSLILTCDLRMHGKVKKNYTDIYYVAAQSKKYKDDIPRLIRKLLQLTRE